MWQLKGTSLESTNHPCLIRQQLFPNYELRKFYWSWRHDLVLMQPVSVACTEAADPKLVTFKRRGGDYIRMLSETVGRERTQLELVQTSRRRKEKKLSILHFCHFWSEHSSITNRLGNPVRGLLTTFSPIPIFIAWFLLVPFITLFFFLLLLSFNHKRARLSQHALCFSAARCWRNVSVYAHNKRLPQVSIHLNKHLKMRRIQLKKKSISTFGEVNPQTLICCSFCTHSSHTCWG